MFAIQEELARLTSVYRSCGMFDYFYIENVIFNDPATIVFWSDGTKTVVKCAEDEVFDEEKGLAMAMSKKVLGNKGNYYNEFKKWLPKEEEELNPFQEIMEGIRRDMAEGIARVHKKLNQED